MAISSLPHFCLVEWQLRLVSIFKTTIAAVPRIMVELKATNGMFDAHRRAARNLSSYALSFICL